MIIGMELEDYPGYLIYPDGRIWSKKTNKYMTGTPDKDGYHILQLNRKMYRIHRLVALAYLPNPLSKSQINHKNGIRTDNRLENLHWATPGENSHPINKVNEPFGCVFYCKKNGWRHVLKINYKQYTRTLPTEQECKLYQLMLKYAFHRLYELT